MTDADFDTTIRPLFSPFDRDAMLFAFDLWRYEDVKANAALILQRVEAGEMPCDQAWPEAKIHAFRAWIAGGLPR